MFFEDLEACTYPSAYGAFYLHFICVSLCLAGLLGHAMPAFAPDAVWCSAGKDGRLMAFPWSLHTAGLWLGSVPPSLASSVGGLWTGYLWRPLTGTSLDPLNPLALFSLDRPVCSISPGVSPSPSSEPPMPRFSGWDALSTWWAFFPACLPPPLPNALILCSFFFCRP